VHEFFNSFSLQMTASQSCQVRTPRVRLCCAVKMSAYSHSCQIQLCPGQEAVHTLRELSMQTAPKRRAHLVPVLVPSHVCDCCIRNKLTGTLAGPQRCKRRPSETRSLYKNGTAIIWHWPDRFHSGEGGALSHVATSTVILPHKQPGTPPFVCWRAVSPPGSYHSAGANQRGTGREVRLRDTPKLRI
jgi:hypothetical protein